MNKQFCFLCIALLSLLLLPCRMNGQGQPIYHTIQQGETLYRLTQTYGVSAETICAANPNLSATNFPVGRVVEIPAKSGSAQNQTIVSQTTAAVRVAVLLPFKTKGTDGDRSLEFYRGLLLAADSMKRQGVSLDIYAYHSGATEVELKSILHQLSANAVNLVFGGYYPSQRPYLNSYAQTNHIKVVCPFAANGNALFENPYWTLPYPDEPTLNEEIYRGIFQLFSGKTVAFAETQAGFNVFSIGLLAKLQTKKQKYAKFLLATTDKELQALFPRSKHLLVVPTSDNPVAMQTLVARLQLFRANNPAYTFSLLAYPAWQDYIYTNATAFYSLDTYVFTPYFAQLGQPQTAALAATYRASFHAEMPAALPSPFLYGFDCGLFFLKGVARFGTNFGAQDVYSQPYQNSFRMRQPTTDGAWINTAVSFLHYTTAQKIQKIDLK